MQTQDRKKKKYIKTYDSENLKLNCQQVHPSTQLPSASVNDSPSWINFSMSTLQRNVWINKIKILVDKNISKQIEITSYLILYIAEVTHRPSNYTRKLRILQCLSVKYSQKQSDRFFITKITNHCHIRIFLDQASNYFHFFI